METNSNATVFVEVKCEPTEITTMSPRSNVADDFECKNESDPISVTKPKKPKNSGHVAAANYAAPTLNPENDLVCNLLETPFSDWKDHCKADLFATCRRPTPPLAFKVRKENKRTGKSYNIQFKRSWYRDFSWLCGSAHVNKLFCWPCLLVGTRRNVWTRTGFGDFLNITRALHIHANSAEHLKCTLQLKQLEKNGNAFTDALNENSRLHVAQFNENVRLNRLFMRIVVDAVLFLIKREITFETNFNELLWLLLSNSTLEIKNQYEKIKDAFVEDLSGISGDLIDRIFEYVKDHVVNEIGATRFFSMQVGDLSTHASQFYVVLRYVNLNGELVERFLGFYDVADRSPEVLFDALRSILNQFNYKSKLIAQSYDGGCVRSGRLHELQAKINDEAPQAIFVHCSSHALDVVVEQILGNSTCRLFFAKVNRIPRLFQRLSKRSHLMNPINGITDLRWCSTSGLITKLVDNWDVLKALFGEILNDEDSDHESVYLSQALSDDMNDFEFAFLARVFDEIFRRITSLITALQENRSDVVACVAIIESTCESLRPENNGQRFAETCAKTERKANENVKNYKQLYDEILGEVSMEIKSRFRNTDRLRFLDLADCSKFEAHTKKFPVESLAGLQECYPRLFGRTQRLKNELDLIYRDERYRNVDVETLVKVLKGDDLHADIFEEAYKLFCLALTVPSFASMGPNGSCSRRIQACLGNETAKMSPSLKSVTIEKGLLLELIEKQPFYDDIIDRYAAVKDRGIDLIYKK